MFQYKDTESYLQKSYVLFQIIPYIPLRWLMTLHSPADLMEFGHYEYVNESSLVQIFLQNKHLVCS